MRRKTRLPETQRATLWQIFEGVRDRLKSQDLTTHAAIFTALSKQMEGRKHMPFDFVVVDEAQDISIAQLRFLAALGASRPNALFFAGDLGQRIFQQPFSWKALGIDIRGRSRTLHINYRTSHQIRMQADRLLGPEITDVDGNLEERTGTVSVFNGPPPMIQIADSHQQESALAAAWLNARQAEGFQPHEIGIFVRSTAEMDRAKEAANAAGLRFKVLDERAETTAGHAAIGTMHLAKPWPDGTTVLVFSGVELIGRLAALVPPPKQHAVRYFGVFAPHSKLRPLVVPKPPMPAPSPSCCILTSDTEKNRYGRRTPWAQLLQMVFGLDVLQCPRCSCRMQRIAFLTQPRVIRRFLDAITRQEKPP